jgi:TATA-box binding protein (TBP) (component of TFIID and TFIIIB)
MTSAEWAQALQQKVEEIVRSVVIPKFNANADLTCTKEELAGAQFTAGAVSSVFGRAGDVSAAAGDYDAAKIGYTGAASGLSARNVQAAVDELASGLGGKAASAHAHGNLSSDGKLGVTAGNLVVTGAGGAVEAKGAVAAGIATLDAGSKVTPLQAASDETEITANHTLELADAGRDLVCTNSADITVTVPLYASAAFPLDTEIVLFRAGAGAVSVAFAAGVTVWCRQASFGIADRYSGVLLKKRASDNTWSLEGNLG